MAATVAHCVFPGLDQEEHSAQPCSAAAEERRVRDIHGQHQPRGPALQHRLRARPRRSLSQLPPWTRRSRWTRRRWCLDARKLAPKKKNARPSSRSTLRRNRAGGLAARSRGRYLSSRGTGGRPGSSRVHSPLISRARRKNPGSLRTIDPTCALRDVSANGGEASVLFLSRSSCFTIEHVREPLVVGEG
jgi:hypothetical protein